MKLVGITGGIGAGKSVVSRLFSLYGIPVYDSDYQAKQLMASSLEIRSRLIKAFGERTFIGKTLDKSYLAARVFSNPADLSTLNSIVHPVVCSHFKTWADSCNAHIVAVESAILFESGLDALVDKIVVVTAPYEIRLHRAAVRDNVSCDKIRARIDVQLPQNKLSVRADYLIENDDKLSLIMQTDRVVRDLLK